MSTVTTKEELSDELAEEAYTVLRDALKASGKVGLGQLAMRGKETLVSVRACGRALVPACGPACGAGKAGAVHAHLLLQHAGRALVLRQDV